jgi:ribonuclease P protein component
VLRLGEESPLLVGFSIKRTAGNAVIRNRLRRRTRAAMAEVFHQESSKYSGALCLAVVSPTADAIAWEDLKGQVAECFAKSGLLNE